jgi:hypothetical protein
VKELVDKSTKPVLILGGAGTALAGVFAFAPAFAMEDLQKQDWVPEYTILVQHWGFLVGLFGLFMIAAAFKASWRTPVLLFGLIEKLYIVYLVVSNAGAPFAKGLYPAAAMDTVLSLWLIAYFLTRAKK